MNATPETTVIEINGVKLEVDLRHAKRIDTFRIGSRVKLLRRATPYSSHKLFPGVIVAFDPFVELPTITVAYIDSSNYGKSAVEFAVINSSKESRESWEMVPAVDDDELMLNRDDVVRQLAAQVTAKQAELDDAVRKVEYFQKAFAQWFDRNAATTLPLPLPTP